MIVQPSLQPPGGGNGVAAWALQALVHEHDVSLLTLTPVCLDVINEYYGTSLHCADFKIHLIRSTLYRLLCMAPFPFSRLKSNLLLRTCKRKHRDYDVILTFNNEADFGRRGIQYIHFPWAYSTRPKVDLRWYHRIPFALKSYNNICKRITNFSFERMRSNLTLVNSDWTGEKVRERYNMKSITLYPPALGEFPNIPWEQRENGFVCIGRISPEKELEKIIDILSDVREKYVDINLKIIGSPDNANYTRLIRDKCQTKSWILLYENLARSQLLELLAKQRYGIHGMRDEHFGMAVAELIRAGRIVFTPDSGGQVEIIGHDQRLLYKSKQDAVQKISAVLSDHELQHELLRYLATRGEQFSTERFTNSIRDLVRDF